MSNFYVISRDLTLGRNKNARISLAEQRRQKNEVKEILKRLRRNPGVLLADEVGMGKTYVALGVAYCIAVKSRRAPVVIMVPPNLVSKWKQDLCTFCELYLRNRRAIDVNDPQTRDELQKKDVIRYGVARKGIDFLKLLDDPLTERCHIVFLTHGAMARGLDEPFVYLALIQSALKGSKKKRIKLVRKTIHRFLGELLYVKFRQNASRRKEKIWQDLIKKEPKLWKDIYNKHVRSEKDVLLSDPIPKAVRKVLEKRKLLDFSDLIELFASDMPVKAGSRVSERIRKARASLREKAQRLWIEIIKSATWYSPLLIMDEAHHLKNPKTVLARELQNEESLKDMKIGDGSLSEAFGRMLFLTATPFQLGHNELIRVMRRFGDIRWDTELGSKADHDEKLSRLLEALDDAQRSSIRLFKTWKKLKKEELPGDGELEDWWKHIAQCPIDELSMKEKSLRNNYEETQNNRKKAETLLRPWIIRYNKGEKWLGTNKPRRKINRGTSILAGMNEQGGIRIPSVQLLPFFLAARSASENGKDLLGEALSSSYEAFRYTRLDNKVEKDDDLSNENEIILSKASWYLSEFDRAIDNVSGKTHPKVSATVQRVVDLWEKGEKVVVFAFYIRTCQALRIHISNEMEKRMLLRARRRLAGARKARSDEEIERILKSIEDRYFDNENAPGRRALDTSLRNILEPFTTEIQASGIDAEELLKLMRRFLRVWTTLVRVFPLHEHDTLTPHLAVRSMLDSQDGSRTSWRNKFKSFIEFLTKQCSSDERKAYIAAAVNIQTGGIWVQSDDEEEEQGTHKIEGQTATLANIKVATGKTKKEARARLMLAFNTPFFPDILVASSVMGEGIDLHRYCRYVIHHDLSWNPSDIEQRTGRIDRLGCKAENNRQPIEIFLPYIEGTADERQFRVMSIRESWFKIVMGQEEVARLIPEEGGAEIQPPRNFLDELRFDLSLEKANPQ